jgi:hypothetical protein
LTFTIKVLVQNVRRLLFAVLVLGMLGTGSELLLLNHLENWTQLIPIGLLACAVLALAWLVVRPGSAPMMLFQGTMALFVAAGVIGIVLHYQGARAFQLEVNPSLNGSALFWKTVRAKAPPALAPASMIGLGLIGFAYTQSVRREE